jgi:hypothetical protein
VLAIRGRVPLEPLLHGGGQERERRSGTENVAGASRSQPPWRSRSASAFAAAARVGALRDRFTARVLALVPSSRLTGHPVRRLPSLASFTFAGTSGESVLLELERLASSLQRLRCAPPEDDEPSHVLLALGITPSSPRPPCASVSAMTSGPATRSGPQRCSMPPRTRGRRIGDGGTIGAVSTPVVTVIVPDATSPYAPKQAVDSSTPNAHELARHLGRRRILDATGRLCGGGIRRSFPCRPPIPSRGCRPPATPGWIVETPFVGFLDADDVLTPRALERFVDTLTRSAATSSWAPTCGCADEAQAPTVPAPCNRGFAATDPPRLATTLAAHPEVSGNRGLVEAQPGGAAAAGGAAPSRGRSTRISWSRSVSTPPRAPSTSSPTSSCTGESAPMALHHAEQESALLEDYLDALSGGIAVLDGGQRAPSAPASVSFWRWTSPPLFASRKTALTTPTDARSARSSACSMIARMPSPSNSTTPRYDAQRGRLVVRRAGDILSG